jgi:hypothetical protein
MAGHGKGIGLVALHAHAIALGSQFRAVGLVAIAAHDACGMHTALQE